MLNDTDCTAAAGIYLDAVLLLVVEGIKQSRT
jgi:hypothetical protein